MSVYIIVNLRIRDADGYRRYVEGFGEIFGRYQGTVLAADPAPQSMEGAWPYHRTAILEFPDKEEALRWYNDPDYQELAKLRFAASGGDMALIAGMASAAPPPEA